LESEGVRWERCFILVIPCRHSYQVFSSPNSRAIKKVYTETSLIRYERTDRNHNYNHYSSKFYIALLEFTYFSKYILQGTVLWNWYGRSFESSLLRIWLCISWLLVRTTA
jgi:hypothetical protein